MEGWATCRDASGLIGRKVAREAPPQELSLRRLEAQKEAAESRITAMKAKIGRKNEEEMDDAEDDDEPVRDEYENRIVVKFFWKQLGQPTDPEEWKYRDGVISVIRRRMRKGAPTPRTVERTLQRLAEDENDGCSSRQAAAGHACSRTRRTCTLA